ncbi:hypothetical protein COLO4_37673 [Corchorus olitorius]|uniref:Uncharacterized protein n=1 Tax=Corchorus olitorius TaxID=93759 RepID=A0A1R3G064_9ROSI|nr:hypothetical protein COLO4_37673 [Corchorus olitorius]
MDKGKRSVQKGNQKKKAPKKNEKLISKNKGKEKGVEISSKLKKGSGRIRKKQDHELLKESPCEEVPFNHFRNTIHRMRYDDISEFNLFPAKTFD